MQLFHFWSRDIHPVQNLLLCTKFHENPMIFHWDMAIYRFLKWRPSAILELFYHHTRLPSKSLLLAASDCLSNIMSIWYTDLKIIAIWIFCIFGLKCLFSPQNGGIGGLWTPKCDYSSSRPSKGTSLRKSASFKLSTVKIRWAVWPVGELTRSVTDTHTQTYTQVNLYSAHALHSIGQTIKHTSPDGKKNWQTNGQHWWRVFPRRGAALQYNGIIHNGSNYYTSA